MPYPDILTLLAYLPEPPSLCLGSVILLLLVIQVSLLSPQNTAIYCLNIALIIYMIINLLVRLLIEYTALQFKNFVLATFSPDDEHEDTSGSPHAHMSSIDFDEIPGCEEMMEGIRVLFELLKRAEEAKTRIPNATTSDTMADILETSPDPAVDDTPLPSTPSEIDYGSDLPETVITVPLEEDTEFKLENARGDEVAEKDIPLFIPSLINSTQPSIEPTYLDEIAHTSVPLEPLFHSPMVVDQGEEDTIKYDKAHEEDTVDVFPGAEAGCKGESKSIAGVTLDVVLYNQTTSHDSDNTSTHILKKRLSATKTQDADMPRILGVMIAINLPIWHTPTYDSGFKSARQDSHLSNLYHFTIMSDTGYIMGESFFDNLKKRPLAMFAYTGPDIKNWAKQFLLGFVHSIVIPLTSPLAQSLLPISHVIPARPKREVMASIVLMPTTAEKEKGHSNRNVRMDDFTLQSQWIIFLHTLNVLASYKRHRLPNSPKTLCYALPPGITIPLGLALPSNIRIFNHRRLKIPGITSPEQTVFVFDPHGMDEIMRGLKGVDDYGGKRVARELQKGEIVGLGEGDGLMVFTGYAEMMGDKLEVRQERRMISAGVLFDKERYEAESFPDGRGGGENDRPLVVSPQAGMGVKHAALFESPIGRQNDGEMENDVGDGRAQGGPRRRRCEKRSRVLCVPEGTTEAEGTTTITLQPNSADDQAVMLETRVDLRDVSVDAEREEWDVTMRRAVDILEARYISRGMDTVAKESQWRSLVQKFQLQCDQTYLIAGGDRPEGLSGQRGPCANEMEKEAVTGVLPLKDWVIMM